MSAEKELRELSIKLDCNEYDDYDEYEEVLSQLYPDVVFDVAKRAANEGGTNGMHLYGIMLAKKAMELKESAEDYKSLLKEARSWVVKSAEQGCWGAMNDLATEQVDLLEVPIDIQLAFYKLANPDDDLEEHINYLKEHCACVLTEEQREYSMKIYDELINSLERNGVTEKKMCECIFP